MKFMKFIAPTKSCVFGTAVLSAMMILSLLVPAKSADASMQSGSPCPSYSIQDVFNDPNGNWDGDLVRNSDELYNGLNPCIVDTTNFCSGGGNPLCLYPTYTYGYTYYPSACQASINAFPNADYDGDGISNNTEILNGADPCKHPCPNPTGVDLRLNPNGSWDGDGISNAIEVADGTDPCNGFSHAYGIYGTYNPCPYYSNYDVAQAPGADWDKDGVSNSTEVYRGTNPCVFNVRVLPKVTTTYTTQQRLPHVQTLPTRTYVAPAPTPKPRTICPAGYPYYHSGNGLCYANPVGYFIF